MQILFDECIPHPLRRELVGHDVQTVQELGWSGIKNGALLNLAERQFDVFLTVDKGIQHQQNLRSTVLRFIVLRARSNRLEDLLPLVPSILTTLETIQTGSVIQLPIKH